MPHIFNRLIPTEQTQLCHKLDDLASSGTDDNLAICENLAIDDRVTDPRFANFLKRSSDDEAGTPIKTTLEDYRRSMSYSEMQSVEENGSNIVFVGGASQLSVLSGGTMLVTVQRLFNSWHGSLENWLRKSKLELGGSTALVDRWLAPADGQLGLVSPSVARSLCESYAEVVASVPDRPTFVGLWDEFADHLDLGLFHWFEVFGLGNWLEPEGARGPIDNFKNWFLVLRYPMAQTKVTARPTVLEAGQNAWHYPTPSHFPLRAGGKTVVLGAALEANIAPLSEFVHTPRLINPEDVWGIVSYPADKTPVTVDLTHARTRHKHWLENWQG